MKSLSDLVVFNLLDKQSIISVVSKIDEASDRVKLSQLEESLRFINRRFNDPLKTKVIEQLQAGKIIPVFSDKLKSLPRFLPIVHINKSGERITYVNLSHFARVDKSTNDLDIKRSQLYALLQGGLIFNEISDHHTRIFGTNDVMTYGSMLYARVIAHQLDRGYGIGSSSLEMDQVLYLLARFFLVSMLERKDDERTKQIAAKATKNGTTQTGLNAIDNKVTTEDLDTIETFVKALSENFPRLSKLNLRWLIAEATNAYDQLFIMAMESPHYFFLNVTAVIHNAYLNNEAKLEPLLGDDSLKFYNALVRSIK